MPCRPSSPSPQSRATTTTITATTAKRQIWSTVSMSMHHRTTTTAATVLEEEVYGDKPVFSRHSKAGDDPLNATAIAPTTFTSKSSSSSTSSLPPPYSATQQQQAAPPSSLTPSSKPEEQQHTKSSSWRFEIALEGGSCVIRQLGHPAAQAAAPTERDGGAMGILSCIKALFSIVAGTVMAVVGVIVSVVAVLVTRVFPSMAARAPETVARSSSDNAIAGSRKRKLSPAPGSSTSSPSIGDRQVLSPSDLSLVGSTSTGLVSSSPLPGIQRHVTFNLEQTKSSATGSVSSGGGKSRDDIVGLNTPTIATFAPADDDDEKEVSEMGVVVRAATTLSSVPATSSGSKKRKSWFMKRRAATLASTGSDVDDSSDAGTIASMTNSAPPTPSTLVTELPPVSEEDAGSGADAAGGAKEEKKDAAKSGRRISLKLQFGGKSWKRRSGSAFVEGPTTGAEEEVNSEMAEATTPSSAVSSSSVPMPPPSTNPTVTSKQQKRRSFPFVGSSNTTSIPSTAPIRPTARTNPYGAPYFAAPPTARLAGSYDDAATQSDRESSGHRRAESADGGSTRSFAVRQDSTGSGFSRASSSLTSGTGSESGLGLRSDGGVSEVGELVVQTPPSSPPPQATSSSSGSKKKTSPYSKPRLPSTLPTSPLSSAAFTSSSSAGRVASDSTAVLASQGSQKNQDRKRTSSSSNRPPVVDRHARMRDAALAWASDSEMASGNASVRVRRGSASVAVRGESRLRE